MERTCGCGTATSNERPVLIIKMFKLGASLICADMANIQREIELIEDGACDHIHFDVMDGVFVPRYGLHPELLGSIRKLTDLPIDVHLMVTDPEKYIGIFVDNGATFLTIHAEACVHLHRALSNIRKAGAKAGVAFNHSTPLGALDYIMDDIDLVLIMAINPGVVGHKLIPGSLNKISDTRSRLEGKISEVIIEVDGGVTFENAPKMLERGADLLVCGSATIFKDGTRINQNAKEFRLHLSNLGDKTS